MKLQYLRDWDAVDDNSGETYVQYIDDKGVNRTLAAPTWLLAAMAVHLIKTHAPPCKGNDDNPAAWCNGCMEDIKEELREQEFARRRDPYRALSSVRSALQRKLLLERSDRTYKQQDIADLLQSAIEEVESDDLFEE